jgi:lipoprotein NlpI
MKGFPALLLTYLLSATPYAAAQQPGPANNAEPPGSRCLEAVLAPVENHQNTACDVEIERLNRLASRTAQQQTELAAAYHNRAVLLLRGKQTEPAEADLTQALQLQPGMTAAYLTRGNLRLFQTRFTEALTDFNQAITSSQGSEPAFLINRALALRGMGEIAAAAQDMAQMAAALNGVSALNPSGIDAPPGDGSR